MRISDPHIDTDNNTDDSTTRNPIQNYIQTRGTTPTHSLLATHWLLGHVTDANSYQNRALTPCSNPSSQREAAPSKGSTKQSPVRAAWGS